MLSVSSLCPSSCLSYSTSLQSLLYLLVTPLISSLSTRVPSHTDTMLPALCSLFTALSCVSGVTVVTQKPPVLTLTAGQTANMDCNLGTVTTSAARWYKQVPGGVPHTSLQSLLYLLVTPLISSLSTRVPSHTDTMLPALCSLFTALSCVSGVIVVTQKPPVLTLTAGQTANMDCNLGTVTTSAARWYKQVPGGVPQYVLRHYHGWSSPSYGSGFSSPKFTSTYSSKSDYKLIISNVEVGDSAVYYCHTWDSSAKEHVFGQGTKLIVSNAALPSPVLKVLPPSTEELKTNKATLVCLASDMSVGFADVSWLVDGKSVTSGVITGSAQQQDNKKFTLSSYLTIDSSEWDNDKVITCEVSAGGKAASVKINKSECSE
ncbi:immunoglobulin lambda-1 light chain-like [Tachysurus vachellii]|uniref:immunoglobulin lambda-1 light chain-like n=1 Tax=Tachysurus vachellii TaxID=175792 RepID=UPI00296B459B|nr:immunoglobulin lambda-1 light chain-like [Tachysurus vachellii]